MKKYIEAVLFAALLGAAASPVACGSKSSGSFDQGDGGGDDSGKVGSSSSSGGSSGGTSSGGSGGSGGSSGAFTQGDSGGMGTGVCKTGTYSGPFSCGFYFDPDSGTTAPTDGGAADGGLAQITGNLSFLLTQSTGGGEIGTDIASGTFAISAGLFITGMATLGGTLDCSSGIFTGSLTGGTYSVFFGLFMGTFNGPLMSDYNGTSFSFVDGTWSLTIPGEGYCQGQWNASYAGVGDAGDQ
jgi:hypothetical protein